MYASHWTIQDQFVKIQELVIKDVRHAQEISAVLVDRKVGPMVPVVEIIKRFNILLQVLSRNYQVVQPLQLYSLGTQQP